MVNFTTSIPQIPCEEIISGVVALCLSSTGTVFNMFLLILFFIRRRLVKRKSNKFLINLVVSDMLVSISLLGLSLISVIQSNVKPVSLNKAYNVLYAVLIPLSIINLLILTIDRLVAIKLPFFYTDRFKNRHVYATVSISWIVCIIEGLVNVLYYPSNMFAMWRYVKIASKCFLTLLIFAFVLLATSNMFIFLAAKQQLNSIKSVSPVDLKNSHRYQRRECRIARMTIGMAMAYIVCWVPSCIFLVHVIIAGSFSYELSKTGWVFISFYYALDPILYVCLSSDVKLEIKKITRQVFDSPKQVDPQANTTATSQH